MSTPHPDTLPYNKEIGKKVSELAGAGVPVKEIFSVIQSYQYPPGSLTTFYKLYRKDMDTARALNAELIGNRVIHQAIKGDIKDPATFKSQDLFLRSQAGWSPKTIEETREIGSDEEETESAVEALMKALGKNVDE